MGLFNKNPNEVAYVGGKKHWADVIKNSGSGELLIWRQPEEDFNTNSTLVVMPGEEAIFIKGGIVESVSENGTYHLATDNYPFISRIRNFFTGGVSTFSCVVYFVRKADSHEIYWGTDSPIQIRDKVWGVRPCVWRSCAPDPSRVRDVPRAACTSKSSRSGDWPCHESRDCLGRTDKGYWLHSRFVLSEV